MLCHYTDTDALSLYIDTDMYALLLYKHGHRHACSVATKTDTGMHALSLYKHRHRHTYSVATQT